MGMSQRSPRSDDDVLSLTARFDDATVDLASWDHAAHLVAALAHVRRAGADGALAHFRVAIPRLLLALRVDPNAYHETMTRAWIELVALVDAALPAELPLGARADAVVARLGDKNLLLRFYSRDRLVSHAARLTWVAPDLRPLDAP